MESFALQWKQTVLHGSHQWLQIKVSSDAVLMQSHEVSDCCWVTSPVHDASFVVRTEPALSHLHHLRGAFQETGRFLRADSWAQATGELQIVSWAIWIQYFHVQ